MSFDNNLKGVLFKNDKGDNPNRPDYTGKCEIGGVKYHISGWINMTQLRTAYMSLKFSPAFSSGARGHVTSPNPAAAAPFNDDIPF